MWEKLFASGVAAWLAFEGARKLGEIELLKAKRVSPSPLLYVEAGVLFFATGFLLWVALTS